MKQQILLPVFCLLAVLEFCRGDFKCHPILAGFNEDYTATVCYKESCAKKIQKHIREEFLASFNYLYLATYFDQENVNRPGLAKFLYEAASEERQHAIMMLQYLNSRGIQNTEDFEFTPDSQVPGALSYKDTMILALNLEIDVTDKIHKIIADCEIDFHAADTFTEPILAEQHSGIRQLQGMLKEFHDLSLDMTDSHNIAFAEYIFDQKLLKGEF